MADISVNLSARLIGDTQLAQALARISSHDVPKAVEAGVRYAAHSGKVLMVAEMRRAGVVVSSARLKEDLFVQVNGATAHIWANAQPVSAQHFKPRQAKAGLNLTFYRGQKTLIKSGFLQYNRSQRSRGKLAFKPTTARRYRYDRTRNSPRKGMQFVFGLSVASMYLGGKHKDRIQAAVENRIEERLETGILRALGAAARGYGASAR
jgi:hypothetical protein